MRAVVLLLLIGLSSTGCDKDSPATESSVGELFVTAQAELHGASRGGQLSDACTGDLRSLRAEWQFLLTRELCVGCADFGWLLRRLREQSIPTAVLAPAGDVAEVCEALRRERVVGVPTYALRDAIWARARPLTRLAAARVSADGTVLWVGSELHAPLLFQQLLDATPVEVPQRVDSSLQGGKP